MIAGTGVRDLLPGTPHKSGTPAAQGGAYQTQAGSEGPRSKRTGGSRAILRTAASFSQIIATSPQTSSSST
jgi:hypothetical protein